MLNFIIRYSNVTAGILLFGDTDLPVQVKFKPIGLVFKHIPRDLANVDA